MTKFEAIFMRFAKGFLSGGLGAVATLLAAGFALKSFADLRTLGLAALAAFISGGILAIQKLISWQEPEKPIEIKDAAVSLRATEAKKKKA